MAGYVPNVYSAALLDLLVGRTSQGTATVYLGLATALPEDPRTATLANITEVGTAGYARIAVPAFSAATTSPVQITTPTSFSFANFTADHDVNAPILYAFLTTAASGTGAPIRYIWYLAQALTPAANTPVDIPASTLIIE